MSSLLPPWDSYLKRIHAAHEEELDALEHELFGRKAGVLTIAMKDLSSRSSEERREQGKVLNTVKAELLAELTARRDALNEQTYADLRAEDALDMTLDLPAKQYGHAHPIHEFIRSAEEIFGRMGFESFSGPEIESEELNFNKLNIPSDHPARDMQDTFWVSSENKTVLRTHTSAGQIRYMLAHKPPLRMISAGKVFRKDSDATHSPMFHQIEGLMVGRDVSLANMKAVMETVIRELIDPHAEFRWRAGYFPFVEPGLEVDVRWRGDEAESREGKWLEIVGCGMVHPHVLQNVGIDPAEFQGFAFGFGVERMIMIKHRIPDLRLFYGGNTAFLDQF